MRILHQLEASVALMFVVTFLAILVILEALGLGGFALTMIACFLFYLLGRVRGYEIGSARERQIFTQHDRMNHDR